MSAFQPSTTTTNGKTPAKPAKSGTDVTVTNDVNSHDTTRITGDQVTYDQSTTRGTSVHGEWPAEADAHVRMLIDQAQQERQKIEDKRANHRNFNRMLTLFGALVISFVLTWLLYYDHSLPLWAHKLAPFSFAITILMDSSFTVYALIRHY